MITDFTIYQGQLTEAEIAALAGLPVGTATQLIDGSVMVEVPASTDETNVVDEVFEGMGQLGRVALDCWTSLSTVHSEDRYLSGTLI